MVKRENISEFFQIKKNYRVKNRFRNNIVKKNIRGHGKKYR